MLVTRLRRRRKADDPQPDAAWGLPVRHKRGRRRCAESGRSPRASQEAISTKVFLASSASIAVGAWQRQRLALTSQEGQAPARNLLRSLSPKFDSNQ
jgi:hypothetical protein